MCVRAKEHKFGLMVQFMKATGFRTKRPEKADLFMQTETIILASGRMIKLKGMVYTCI